VPPGLALLTAAQRALADFLRVDEDLLAIAAAASPPLEEIAEDPGDLTTWVSHLSVGEKDRLLARVVQGQAARVRMELLRRFRGDTAPAIPVPTRRTVADLLDDAARRRAGRQRRLATQRAEDEARREQERLQARDRRLGELAGDEDAAWSRVDALIATKKSTEYDVAVTLLADLQALAVRQDRYDTFTLRTIALRQAHTRKSSLIERLNRAGI
jgi:hypothetical protein